MNTDKPLESIDVSFGWLVLSIQDPPSRINLLVSVDFSPRELRSYERGETGLTTRSDRTGPLQVSQSPHSQP